jgi:hypothetical protein
LGYSIAQFRLVRNEPRLTTLLYDRSRRLRIGKRALGGLGLAVEVNDHKWVK